jgi:hypothetical protein
MNRNLSKATMVGLATMAGLGSAMAQQFPPAGWPEFCAIGTSLTQIYSIPYTGQLDWSDLFGVFMGTGGQVTYGTNCYTNNVTLDNQGRIGFMIGSEGSVQDTAYGGSEIDNWLYLTMGMPIGVAGNFGYAKSVRQEGTTAAVRTGFGANAIDTTYFGASDRYFVGETTNDNIRISLRVDIMGDTGRLQWTMTNQGPQANIGLEFGQVVTFFSPSFISDANFIDVPGYRPIQTDKRFVRNPNLSATSPHENPMPPYANFGVTQSLAYGLSVPTMATSNIPDQTPVDILDIGKSGFLLGPQPGNTMPMPAAYSTPSPILEDTPIGEAAYVQRWLPVLTNQNENRIITAYYRTTWGVSDYQKPYSIVVDTPKVVGVNDSNPNVFNPNPMTIRVYIDNSRGFSSVEKPIPLNDVRITLNLPQGMTDANNPSSNRIVKFIDVVPPVSSKGTGDPILEDEHHHVKFADFQVNVDPNLFGIQQYTVTVSPTPGPTKTVTGTINVASQPRLLIRDTANLVTAPWQFSNTTWATILGNSSDPLVINRDFQAFEWDSAQQAYVLQTGPKRGFGNWIISNKDVGYTQLGGNPTTPPDLATGAPLVILKPGWNLIANPYNYSIPISQIVGVASTDPSESQTFADLASQNIISSTLSYWDQNTQSYKFTGDFTDMLVPNRGYWVYVSSSDSVTISFPPVYAAFIPQGTGGILKPNRAPQNSSAPKPSGLRTASKWRLNLTVRTNAALDDQNFFGIAKNNADVPAARVMKPPVAPSRNAVSASFVQRQGTRDVLLAQALMPDVSRNEWNWQVYTKSAGSATVAWPNVSQVPANVRLSLIDLATNKSIDMRKQSTYTFDGKALSNRQFKIVADSGVVSTGPVLTTVQAQRDGRGKDSPFTIRYLLGSEASTTVRVLSNGREVYVITRDRQDRAGSNSTSWNLRDAANRRVRAGVYTIEVSAAAAGRATEVKTTSVFVY